MPSWKDGETSDESLFGDSTTAAYEPDAVYDATFCGVDEDAPVVCRVHKMKPERKVAFEGTNTGRKFYACQVDDHVFNCGFVAWIDPEWPESLKNTLASLWGMYEDAKDTMIVERHNNSELLNNLSQEKRKVEGKYTTLLNDMNEWMDCTAKKVMEENYHKIMNNRVDLKLAVCELEKENQKLKDELLVMKKGETEVLKIKERKWDALYEEIKGEKKKLEYSLYDLLKASEGNKEKIKRIREICEE